MKWEYEAIRLINDRLAHGINLTKLLNEFGQDRWELVSADLEQDCFIFKRPASLEVSEELKKESVGIG